MVVSKPEFEQMKRELNESFSKMVKRIEELEAQVAALQKPKSTTKAA